MMVHSQQQVPADLVLYMLYVNLLQNEPCACKPHLTLTYQSYLPGRWKAKVNYCYR